MNKMNQEELREWAINQIPNSYWEKEKSDLEVETLIAEIMYPMINKTNEVV
jgi:hypothetical protein